MTAESLAEALEREHHEIDAGIEEFLARRARRGDQRAPLRRALAALRRHIYLEEEFVFPPLDDAGLVAPKEEAIVYPQADATLGTEVEAELRSFLAGGEMPAGWRCQNVRV